MIYPRYIYLYILASLAGLGLNAALAAAPAPDIPRNGPPPGKTIVDDTAIADKIRLLQELPQLETRLSELLRQSALSLRRRVEAGPPFLLRERLGRLDRLQKLLDDPAADLAEKYRRALEAYRIELDYGSTLEAYRDTVKVGERERLVDFLSLGPLSLYYQTLDGKESWIWVNDQRRWQRLSSEDNEAVAEGLRTARKLEPPQLLVLPLPGPHSR